MYKFPIYSITDNFSFHINTENISRLPFKMKIQYIAVLYSFLNILISRIIMPYTFKEHSYLSKKLLKNTSYRNIKVIYQLKIKLNKISKFKKTRNTKK